MQEQGKRFFRKPAPGQHSPASGSSSGNLVWKKKKKLAAGVSRGGYKKGKTAAPEKLRQREEREIKDLEARIEVEMPLSGLTWTPLLPADVATIQKIGLPTSSRREQLDISHIPNEKEGQTKGDNFSSSSTSSSSLPSSSSPSSSSFPQIQSRTLEKGAALHSVSLPRADTSEITTGGGHSNEKLDRARNHHREEEKKIEFTAAEIADNAGEHDDAPTLSRYFFADLPLSSNTQRGLREGGFVLLSQIQYRVIPHALRGADVMGEAKTGSGKTLAFLVPVLECLYRGRVSSIDGVSALILAPTRELAVQIFNVVKVVSKYHDFTAGCLIGGKNIKQEAEQVHALNIVVGTPGRVLQHTEESQLWDATNLKILVIDEADRLADMGFLQTTHFILQQLPSSRQTLFFSATLRTAVKRLASMAARPDAEVISIGGGGGLGMTHLGFDHNSRGGSNNSCMTTTIGASSTPLTLVQTYMIVPPQYKLTALFSFLRTHSNKKSLVFVSSCKQARFVAETFKLLKPGPKLFFLHGRQKQARRIEVFHSFIQRSPACCLISTDLASRGIDFAQLSVGMMAAASPSGNKNNKRNTHMVHTNNDQYRPSIQKHFQKSIGDNSKNEEGEHIFREDKWRQHITERKKSANSTPATTTAAVDYVVQLDCPDSVETYIHRVGRTARMQRSGHALLLLLPSERTFISRLKARKIEPKEVFVNPQRTVKIEHKLQALLASNVELKQLAQQALGCYLRCIALMPDKEVFSVPSDRQTLTLYANGYGLQLPPTISFSSSSSSSSSPCSDSRSKNMSINIQERREKCERSGDPLVDDGDEDIRICGGALGVSTNKKKNFSKLERLKEKIRQKRLEKQEKRRVEEKSSSNAVAGEKGILSSEDMLSSEAVPASVNLQENVELSPMSKKRKATSTGAVPASETAADVSSVSTTTASGQSDSNHHTNESRGRHMISSEKMQRQESDKGEQREESTDQFLFLRLKKPEEDEDHKTLQDILRQEQLIQKPGFKRERLRFRADGSAKVKGLAAAEIPRQHMFFEEEEEEEEEEEGGEEGEEEEEEEEGGGGGGGENVTLGKTMKKKGLLGNRKGVMISHEDIANEHLITANERLNSKEKNEDKDTLYSGSCRQAFLETMKTRLLVQEEADKERYRQRVHERHTQRRVKERQRRQAEAAGLQGEAARVELSDWPCAEESDNGEEESDYEEAVRKGKSTTAEARLAFKRSGGKPLAIEKLNAVVSEALRRVPNGFNGNNLKNDDQSHSSSCTWKEKPPIGGTNKRRYKVSTEGEESDAPEPRAREQEDGQSQGLAKKRRARRKDDAKSEYATTQLLGDKDATNFQSSVDMADEAARLERIALQLMQI